MDRKISRTLVALCLLTVACYSAASTTYSYVGLPYNYFQDAPDIAGAFDDSMKVTGSIELTHPLGPSSILDWSDVLHFSISNGRHTLTDSSPNLHPQDAFGNFIKTDTSGNIVHWHFTAIADVLEGSSLLEILITTESDIFLDTSDVIDLSIQAHEYGGHYGRKFDNDFSLGTWSVATLPAPIPSPALLLTFSLGFIGVMQRREKSLTPNAPMSGAEVRSTEASAPLAG